MKKLLFLLLIALYFPFDSRSQYIRINLLGGFNYNSIFSTTYPAYKNVIVKDQVYSPLGFHGGLVFKKETINKINWSTEIYYSRDILYPAFFNHGLFERKWIGFKSQDVLERMCINFLTDYSLDKSLIIGAGIKMSYSIREPQDLGEYGDNFFEKYLVYAGGLHIGFVVGLNVKLGQKTSLLLRFYPDNGIVFIDCFGPNYSKKHLSHLQTLQISFAYNIFKNDKK